MSVRSAQAAEIDHLAKLWYDGWQDAHARILPAELTRIRTLESFRDRLGAALADVRVVGPVPTPVGFCMLKGDELYQLYVSAEARGTGVAAALVADAEAGSPPTASSSPGSPAPSGTTAPPGSTRSVGGAGQGRWSISPMPPMERRRSKSGGTRRFSGSEGIGAMRPLRRCSPSA